MLRVENFSVNNFTRVTMSRLKSHLFIVQICKPNNKVTIINNSGYFILIKKSSVLKIIVFVILH